jgi:hypothetical protein
MWRTVARAFGGDETLNRLSHGERDALAPKAGSIGMPSRSSAEVAVTIAAPMRPKAPLAHFRLAFSALEFMSIP